MKRSWREIIEVANLCSFPELNWRIEPVEEGSEHYFLQAVNLCAVNNDTGAPVISKGRKLLLSQWMTNNEIVQTCWLAVKLYHEHENRERFHYKGRRVLDPHFSPDYMAEEIARNIPGLREERGYGVEARMDREAIFAAHKNDHPEPHTCMLRTDGLPAERHPCRACLWTPTNA